MWTWWLAWRWPRQMMADVELGNPTNSPSQSTGEGGRDDLTWRMRWTKYGKIRQLLIWIMILPLNMGVWSVTNQGLCLFTVVKWVFDTVHLHCFGQYSFFLDSSFPKSSWGTDFDPNWIPQVVICSDAFPWFFVSTATSASSFEDFQLHTQLQIISISWNTWILDYLTVFV